MKRALVLACVGVGCGSGVPAEPTWIEDVRPILVANCVRCHGSPARFGAPDTFRLDVFDDIDVGVGRRRIRGAHAMAAFIAARASVLEDMPPRGLELAGRQKEILSRWYEANAPRGERAGNREPTARLRWSGGEPPSRSDVATPLLVEVGDEDGDLVYGQLVAEGQTETQLVAELWSGIRPVTWDPRRLPSGTYTLEATLHDDSGGNVTTELETILVSHAGAQRQAPIISFQGLRDSEMIAEADPPPRRPDVRLRVDGPAASVGVVALRPGEVVEIRAPAPLAGDEQLDLLGRLEVGEWRLRAESEEGLVISPPFVIAKGSTSETHDSVVGILRDDCVPCHNGGIVSVYNFGDLSEDDLRDLRGIIYRKVVVTREMPPPSTSAPGVFNPPISVDFTDDDHARLADWLLGGAP